MLLFIVATGNALSTNIIKKELPGGTEFIFKNLNISDEYESLDVQNNNVYFQPKVVKFEECTITFFKSDYLQSLNHYAFETLYCENASVKFLKELTFRTALKMVSFAHNDIRYVPSIFAENLNILHLEHNRIVSMSARAFYDTPNLKELYLSSNRLFAIPNLSLKSDTFNLRILKLDNNRIQMVSNADFKANVELVNVDLSHNKIFRTELNFYKIFPEEFVLRLVGNRCVDQDFTVLNGDGDHLDIGLQKCFRNTGGIDQGLNDIKQILSMKNCVNHINK